MATLTEGKSVLSELKSQHILSLKHTLNLFKYAATCYPLKLALCRFLVHSYLDTEKQIPDKIALLLQIFKVALDDVDLFLEIKSAQYSGRLDDPKLKSHLCLVDDFYGSNTLLTHMNKYIYEGICLVLALFFKKRFNLSNTQQDMGLIK